MENLFNFTNENVNMELFLKYEPKVREALSCDFYRYWHSISVALISVSLASIYGANKDDALVAGLLHDYCKCINKEEMIKKCEEYRLFLSEEDKNADGCIHGFLASAMCKAEFNINDDVKNAIYYHTCGRPNMPILEKIIYMADFIEPLRKFRDKVDDIRNITYTDIDRAVVLASEMNLEFLVLKQKFIHSNTKKTLDYYKNLINNR